MTRRWISAASSRASTGASTVRRSPSRRSCSRKARRSGKRGSVKGGARPAILGQPPAIANVGDRPAQAAWSGAPPASAPGGALREERVALGLQVLEQLRLRDVVRHLVLDV